MSIPHLDASPYKKLMYTKAQKIEVARLARSGVSTAEIAKVVQGWRPGLCDSSVAQLINRVLNPRARSFVSVAKTKQTTMALAPVAAPKPSVSYALFCEDGVLTKVKLSRESLIPIKQLAVECGEVE